MSTKAGTNAKKFVIITSIYNPGEATRLYSEWAGWEVVVVGDRKTPKTWQQDKVTFLSIDDQLKDYPELARLIPENTYTRKMLGYVYAIRNGAEAIFDSDDDNLPYAFAFDTVEKVLAGSRTAPSQLVSENGWANAHRHFGDEIGWPRGFPLEHVKSAPAQEVTTNKPLVSGIAQFLADEDPDVDAVYRMLFGAPITFRNDLHFGFAKGTYSPFNSQATLWTPEAFPLLYFPLGVPDRVTDILRGYIALASLWKFDRTISIHSPIVYQERNPHNLHNDFLQETLLYHHATDWAVQFQKVEGTTVAEVYASILETLIETGHISENNRNAYQEFLKATSQHKSNNKK